MKGYAIAKTEVFANNPFGDFVRKEIPTTFYNTGLIDKNRYLVVGSVGQGKHIQYRSFQNIRMQSLGDYKGMQI